MSLDDSLEELRLFDAALRDFNSAIGQSVRAIRARHEDLDGLWRDAFREEYDRRWESFRTVMTAYLEREAPEFERFLAAKIDSLDRHLHG